MWCGSTTPMLKIISAENIFWCIPHVIILLIYLIKFPPSKKEKSPILIIFFSIILWWGLQCIKSDEIVGMDIMLIVQTLPVYIAYNLYQKKEFFYYFEKVLTALTVASIVIWAGGCLANTQMRSIMDLLSIWDNGNTTYAHLGFVGLGNQYAVGMSIIRNIGFTWEAGRFSGFLVIGLFVNLILHKMQIFPVANNKHFWILAVGLISTFSTTGYGAAIGIVLMYFLNKGGHYRILIVALSLLWIPAIWGLGFFSEKIMNEADTDLDLDRMQYVFDRGETQITPGRITGAYLELENLKHDPLLGYNKNENSYTNTNIFMGNSVWLSNGTLQILSKYGIVFGIFFYFLLIKSSYLMADIFKFKGKLIFFLLFVLINISYNYWDTCVMLYFVYMFLYKKHFLNRNKI